MVTSVRFFFRRMGVCKIIFNENIKRIIAILIVFEAQLLYYKLFTIILLERYQYRF